MPPHIQRLPYVSDSAILFEAIRHLPWAVYLDSAYPMSKQGRYDIIAAAPYKTLVTWDSKTVIDNGEASVSSADDPFQLLRQQLSLESATEESSLPFYGGAIGYFSYDLARRIERLPGLAQKIDSMPEMAIGLYDWALIVDHDARDTLLVGQGRDPATQQIWPTLLDLISKVKKATDHQPVKILSPFSSNLTQAVYHACFNKIQSYIHEGDCYQINFAQRFQARIKADAWALYQRLRRINPAPFSAFLDTPYGKILSSSPERFLCLDRDKRVQSQPIKGTISRKIEPAEDQLQICRLRQSEKDKAENLMIVDLLRNDIGKVCRPGSVEVSKLFEVESFARVHHMVSTIEGQLTDREDALSLLKACFPGGSITGAPKLRAMEIIEELESYRRGIYCGAIGYIGFDGRMDTNIIIRTLLSQQDQWSFWSGGGIVADSIAEAEYQETLDKAAALFDLFEN